MLCFAVSAISSCNPLSFIGDEAVFPIETGDPTHGQQANLNAIRSSGSTEVTGDDPEKATEEMQLIFMHGGMDTEGEIFDDSLVLAL